MRGGKEGERVDCKPTREGRKEGRLSVQLGTDDVT